MDPQFPRRLWISGFPDLFWFFLGSGILFPDQGYNPAHCSGEREESSGHWAQGDPPVFAFVPMR